MPPQRKRLALLAALTLPAWPASAATLPQVVVHKDPHCACCAKWVEHLETHGFRVKTVQSDDLAALKRRLGVPQRLASCHTAEVGGYLIEGHVPAATIKRLLGERAAVAGLAVPGMPIGSPGMEVPGRSEAYEVLSFARDGSSRVYQSFR